MKINQYLDATYLKTAIQAGISEEENLQNVTKLLEEAILYDYKLVMIRAKYITFAKQFLKEKNGNSLTGTVIGFHEGSYSLETKLEEAKIAIDLGTDELDFVINFDEFKKGNIILIKNEVFEGTKLCLENSKVVKWIIEVAALSSKEIIEISRLIKEVVLENFGMKAAQKVFVKSSTGFYKTENNLPNGATFETMKLIVENAKPLQIKAAGGVRDYETAVKMIEIGVDRIGTSSSKEICSNATSSKNSNY
ncbi:MAG: deoxyribose-phosphate aldolase [Flavobacteriia bacterium]|nr:deoxyribose-phosphate aldolase [Flavobacteriia bacterium]OIP47735.1 MAG: deoxyribose-phosphate aldolase [Flavobacteriaceae bacterium CG2_30_31_66]PIV97425.1 MAG: deoxyribose-phosphate aldolase [Flavobacteriaceae bacterium CG17_big_fil_post_rev_8_21_14_2_50_31_13]PIX11776.1 MAG: deoxyribose-phosphate aldolase [Flavobacteriaceae bacterium CG_4_8_14_3_um_filter_31_8]PIY14784.1 MAG: deoxyribose-phosphate aldolase [Flavobacteriaceae bacterium CG_4_10_14_3_um_filter_31_253]PIZ12132.1 MAG: deoxyri